MPKLFKILIAALVLLASSAAVYAYWTGQDESSGIAFGTGSLVVELVDPAQLQFDNLAPGDERVVEWSVKNTGTLPQYLKGRVDGSWDDASVGLVAEAVMVTKVEYQDSLGNWVEVASDPAGVRGDFFHSPSGLEVGLLELAAGQQVEYRLTALLDPTVGDEYQNHTFDLAIHAAARQTSDGADWPSSY